MHIGADIFCDTQIIVRELERRFPAPTSFPAGQAGVPWALGMWADRAFFQNSVNLVFGTLDDRVPAEFIADRSVLRGAPFDIQAMKAVIPQMRDQVRAHFGWTTPRRSLATAAGTWPLEEFQSRGHPRLYEHLVPVRLNFDHADLACTGMDRILAAILVDAGLGKAHARLGPWGANRNDAQSRVGPRSQS